MKKLLLILLCLPFIGFGQNVNIPDANFKAYLVGEPAINTNGDIEIQVSEASSFNGIIYCYNMNISDLTGIEAFTALTELWCFENQLTSLDLSQNTALITLHCHDNQLIFLDLRNGNNNNMEHHLPDYTPGISVFENPFLTCINVDNSIYCNANWFSELDLQHYYSDNCPPSAIQEHNTNKELLKVTGLLGRETKQANQPLFYIYDDGTVEKRIILE
jgi:hypothetical protein